MFSIKLTFQHEKIRVIRLKRSTADKIMLFFKFQVKNFYARHTSQEPKKRKKIILIGHTTCGFATVFCWSPSWFPSRPENLRHGQHGEHCWLKVLWNVQRIQLCYIQAPWQCWNTYFHLVYPLIVFAESVIIFVIFNAICNLILICWFTASKGFCSSTWKSYVNFKMVTRNRIQIPLHPGRAALFPVICSWSCTSSAPKGILGMKRRQVVFFFTYWINSSEWGQMILKEEKAALTKCVPHF